MKFIAAALSILFLATTTFADTVSWDGVYDQSGMSTQSVSCSTFLANKGYTTFGTVPNFPSIGGAQAVEVFGSPNCGTCWSLTYDGMSINGECVSIWET